MTLISGHLSLHLLSKVYASIVYPCQMTLTSHTGILILYKSFIAYIISYILWIKKIQVINLQSR